MAELSYADVAAILKPDFGTGKLYWIPRINDDGWNSRFAGAEAFTASNGEGYKHGTLRKRQYKAHRILWLLHSGSWPKDQIDHINGVRSDNRLVNLREVTNSENLKNQRRYSRNTSGASGVNWSGLHKKWRARIHVNGKRKSLGLFASFEAAAEARKAAEIEFGYHANHGR